MTTKKRIHKFNGEYNSKDVSKDYTKDATAEKLLSQLSNHCMQEIEYRARVLMSAHPELLEYCQGMGTASFSARVVDEDGFIRESELLGESDDINHPELDLDYLFDYIGEWNFLCLTGYAMRFTATSSIITDW